MIRFFLVFIFLLSVTEADDSLFSVEDIPVEESKKIIVNDMTMMPDRRVAVVTMRGEVWILKKREWSKFASGLRNPVQIWMHSGDLIVNQGGLEVTRVKDSDGDGTADEFLAEIGLVALAPSKGDIDWSEDPIDKGIFAGHTLGVGKKDRKLYRSSNTGESRSIFPLGRFLKFPADSIISVGSDEWLVAQSNRTIDDRTRIKFAIQKLKLNKIEKPPFELMSLEQTGSGFVLLFSQKVLESSAEGDWAYQIKTGESETLAVTDIAFGPDEKTIQIKTFPAPEPGKIYRINCDGIWSVDRDPVKNPEGTVQKIK